jgi:uncharacterized protein YcbX
MTERPQGAVGIVGALWRYPAKSMAGERVEEARVVEGGLLGDRAYAVIDRETGRVASAKHPKKWAALMELGASFVAPPAAEGPLPPVRITWPDGESAVSGESDMDARLSETVGRAVALTAARPETISLERVDPLDPEEGILDIGDLMMAGRFSDYAAFHLVTTATLAKISALAHGSIVDARRFRPNVVIDSVGTEAGFVENDWIGRTLAIGQDVRLTITDPTPRCSIPSLSQQGLPKDPGLLRTLVEHNRIPVPLLDNESLPCAGIYGFVVQGGEVRRGDEITFAD